MDRDADRPQAAEAAYRLATSSGHPRWAPAAALQLAVLYARRGRLDDARARCADAVAAGDPEVSTRARELRDTVLGGPLPD